MFLKAVQLKNFRCFSNKYLEFDAPVTLITGANGSGKTSILEALHYACYLKSFKAHSPKELMAIGTDSFFIKMEIESSIGNKDTVQIGFSENKKLIKLNNKAVTSFKEHFLTYTATTLTEDDVLLTKGPPELRRSFLDQFLVLQNPEYAHNLKSLKNIVINRNSLFTKNIRDERLYQLWTEQLIQISQQIRNIRVFALSNLIENSQESALKFGYKIDFNYISSDAKYKDNRQAKEYILKRSLFGAHLDDYDIGFGSQANNLKSMKIYGSRGQQKLILILLKLAQLKILSSIYTRTTFLLDDFMTDFDDNVLSSILSLLTSNHSQLIFTAPHSDGPLFLNLSKHNCQLIKLNSN